MVFPSIRKLISNFNKKMCRYLTVVNGVGQCSVKKSSEVSMTKITEIRHKFKELSEKRKDKNYKGLGFAGGPPNCVFYNGEYVSIEECPCFVAVK